MKIKRGYKRRGAPTLLVGTIGIVAVCALSFVLATLWHNSQQPVSGAQMEAQNSAVGADHQAAGTEEGGDETAGQEEAASTRPAVEWPVFEGAVPENGKVSNSYFDDAIFFGDSISTGIPLYHVADNAAVVAMTGPTPTTSWTRK